MNYVLARHARMRVVVASLLFLGLVLAGCADPAVPAGDLDATPCDYELDDYRGGTPHLMVHWDLEGHDPKQPSGIELEVILYLDDAQVGSATTTTDCLLIDMEDLDADRIHVSELRDVPCVWTGVAHHVYGGDFETVEVAMERTCG